MFIVQVHVRNERIYTCVILIKCVYVWKSEVHPMIQYLVEPPLAPKTLSVSHIIVEEFWPTLLSYFSSVHWGLQAFVHVQLF